MISVALTNGPDSRLMFCGYQYAPDDPHSGTRAVQPGPPRWIRMHCKRGVWVGDLTAFRPVAFSTVEAAQSVLDQLAASHTADFAARLLLVNATTGTEIVGSDA